MKKTCVGCKALRAGFHSSYCELNYKIKVESLTTTDDFPLYTVIPQSECPKPLTYKKLLQLRGGSEC